MRRLLKSFLLISVILLISMDSALLAQWVENGIPVCDAVGTQDTLALVSDGFGGSIIVWQDNRVGNWDIYAQRIDAYGKPLWAANGVPVTTAAGDQRYPHLISDGHDGAIVLFVDHQNTTNRISVQRLNGSGVPAWASGGVQISAIADTITLYVQMTADGAGGAIVAWHDLRVDSLGFDIYAQKVAASGTLQWATNGVVICDEKETQVDPQLVSDGAGGAVIVWEDWRSTLGADIYASRIGADGTAQWEANGVPICVAAGDQGMAKLVSDGASGAIVTWVDSRGATPDIYAQRILEGGTSLWAANGVVACGAAGVQTEPELVSDDASGAIIAWTDYRSGYGDIYAQKVDASGAAKWLANGAAVCNAASDQTEHAIVSNAVGGAIVTWKDRRIASDINVYAQMLESAVGIPQWTANGIPVCKAAGAQTAPAIAADGAGGALVGWTEGRNGSHDVYCQRIERNGYWGYPAPSIYAVRDVPGDQGGKVNLAWKASRLDPWPNQAILNYSIWMAINPAAAASLIESGGAVITDPDEILGAGVGAVRVAQLDGRAFYWKLIGYLYASYLEHYSEHAQTLFDSTAVCAEYHYFQVIANASGSKGYWISAPDSGYSVDNLPPSVPCGVAGRQLGGDLRITWHRNPEKDLSHYALFRGTAEDFVPQSPILTLTDTVAVDTLWSPSSNDYYYKLVAYDIHGNASVPAHLGPNTIVATLLQGVSYSFGTAGIRIEWRLAECDPNIDFAVSRAEGPGSEFAELTGASIEREGLSFAFIDAAYSAGAIYCYRVEVVGGAERRVLFETEPISTPKMPVTLYQNQPNPFNPSTTIRYYLSEPSHVTLDVYDVSGRRIARLVEKDENAGIHQVSWDGRDEFGASVSSGVYFYGLKAGKENSTRKMVLLR